MAWFIYSYHRLDLHVLSLPKLYRNIHYHHRYFSLHRIRFLSNHLFQMFAYSLLDISMYKPLREWDHMSKPLIKHNHHMFLCSHRPHLL